MIVELSASNPDLETILNFNFHDRQKKHIHRIK